MNNLKMKFNAIPVQIPAFSFFAEINKLILQFIWKCNPEEPKHS